MQISSELPSSVDGNPNSAEEAVIILSLPRPESLDLQQRGLFGV